VDGLENKEKTCLKHGTLPRKKVLTLLPRKKRFFSQSGAQLHYFVNETDSDPNGSIDLSQVFEVQTINSTDFDLVTQKRTYHLQIVPKASMGEDKAEMEYWVKGIMNWLKYTKAEEDLKAQRERETNLQLKALQDRMSKERDQENQVLQEKKRKGKALKKDM
jgi:hypothetical protein